MVSCNLYCKNQIAIVTSVTLLTEYSMDMKDRIFLFITITISPPVFKIKRWCKQTFCFVTYYMVSVHGLVISVENSTTLFDLLTEYNFSQYGVQAGY